MCNFFSKSKLKYLFVIIFIITKLPAQIKIGNNPTIINNSAILELESTNKGVLFPRIALTSVLDTTTISSPAFSLLIYNTATSGVSPNEVTPGYYYWNNEKWVRLSSNTDIISFNEIDGIVGNEVTDVVADGGLVRSGAGTTADPFKIKINDGSATGQVLKWDGTKWVASTDAGLTTEVDGIVGNEVTDVVADGGLVRLGAGTTADPFKIKINDGSATGQVLTWDGAKWIAQNSLNDLWKLTGNSNVTSSNFIGTTNTVDLITKTNNLERMRVTADGNVGIGSVAPVSKLEVNGSFGLPILSTNSNVVLTTNHATVRIDATTTNISVTLPPPNTANGRIYTIIKADTSSNKLVFNSTIVGNGFTFTEANVPGKYVIQSDGTNWILIQ